MSNGMSNSFLSKMLMLAALIFTLSSIDANAQTAAELGYEPCSAYSYDEATTEVIYCAGDVTKKNPRGFYTFDRSKIRGRFPKKGQKISNWTRSASESELVAAGIIEVKVKEGQPRKRGGGGNNNPGNNDWEYVDADDNDNAPECTTTITTKCKRKRVRRAGDGPGHDHDVDVIIKTRPGSSDVYKPRTVYSNPRQRAQEEYRELYDFCTYDLSDEAIEACVDDSGDKDADLIAKQEEVAKLKAEMDALTKSWPAECRNYCIAIAVDPVANGLPAACGIAPDKLAPYLQGKDLTLDPNSRSSSVSVGALDKHYPPQDSVAIRELIGKQNRDNALGDVCGALTKNADCKKEIDKAGKIGECEAYANYLAKQKEYQIAQTDERKLKAAVAAIKGTNGCVVEDITSIKRIAGSGCDCKALAKSSCKRALADAEAQLIEIMNSPRGTFNCPSCGIVDNQGGGQGQACQMYGVCGVSKTAQLISAIGGAAVPLGVSLMGMIASNKGWNTCRSMYSSALDVSRNVGLPPPAPSCGGMMGVGGGFSGMGIGGIGMGGMNPFAMGLGGSMYGMGGMYNPYGMGMNGGINGGINLGFNIGNSGMYNPMMMGGGGIYAGMGGGMYNPMMMGMNGGIGMNGMYGMNNGMYGAQQQMIEAQMRMQEIAAMNMSVQQSSYMGGPFGMMGSPYMNMGYQGGVNPYLNGGLNAGFNANPWMYGSPGMYSGMTGGVQGGVSGGLNIGFNAGTPYYGMQTMQYPGMATPPYAGYQGYGPYGNQGMYQTYNSGNCGWQVGTPCGW